VVEKATKPAEKDPLLAAAEKGDKPQEKAKPTPTALACYQWGEFDSAAASKVKQRLLKVKLAGQMVEMTREAPAAKPAAAPAEGSTNTRYWVHLPPQASREAAVELVMTLKSKGFDSYVVNQAGEMRNAISVGLFSKQASAEGMRDKLTQAGYPAKIEVRENGGSSTTAAAAPAASGKLSTFRLRNLDSDQKAKLELLASEWPQATLKSQACPK
jgi:cell division septation protein DedD